MWSLSASQPANVGRRVTAFQIIVYNTDCMMWYWCLWEEIWEEIKHFPAHFWSSEVIPTPNTGLNVGTHANRVDLMRSEDRPVRVSKFLFLTGTGKMMLSQN